MELTVILGLIATFVASVSVVCVLALRTPRAAVARLKRMPFTGDSAPRGKGAVEAKIISFDQKALQAIRKKTIKTPISMETATDAQKMLHHAGYRSTTALATYNMLRMISMAVLPTVFWVSTLYTPIPPIWRLMGVVGFLLAGYTLPKLILRMRLRRRQKRLRLSLPDALDLLVVCVEAGMGLNQAIVKVSEELERTHPEISDELKLVNLEIRSGRTRAEALRNLGQRTGVKDIVSLAAMLIQTDKFGTSIARSLRVHSDALRTERSQRAEEAAAKTTIKLIFPLLLCIFPALLVVILGPAFLNLARIFGETVIPATQ